jgi:hypothetical protein
MFRRKFNKHSRSNQSISVGQVETSISHYRRDDHGDGRKSRSLSRHRRSPNKSTRIVHSCSRLERILSVSHVRR